MWSLKIRTGKSAKDFYDRVVGYNTAAAAALKKELPPTANQVNIVAHSKYLAIEALIEGLPDGSIVCKIYKQFEIVTNTVK